MYCHNCGAKINETDTFCPKCGVNTTPVALREKKVSSSNATISKSVKGWKSWSSTKKSFSVILGCCLALIIVFSIASLIPDNNTGDILNDSNSDNKINSAFISDFMNNTSKSQDNTRIPVENDSDDSSDRSSSRSSSSSVSDSSSGYVGSVNSDKFHYPHCSYAGKIKDNNKVYFSSRDDAISSGYKPCSHCNP